MHNGVLQPDIMESRNIITAREMVADGSWLEPTMNAEPRLEKPPFPTWLVAVTLLTGTDSLPLQRGMAAAAATLLVFYFYVFAHRFLRMNAYLATLVFVTSYNVVLTGRTVNWDIFCHAFMMAGIFHLARAFKARADLHRTQFKHFTWAGIWLGLSWMSKGPVSFYALLLPFLPAWFLTMKTPLRGHRRGLLWAILLAVVVGGWWFAYILLYASDTVGAVVQKETVAWVNHNARPFWYYWQFFLESGVWSLLLLTSLIAPLCYAVAGEKGKNRLQAWGLRLRSLDRAYAMPALWMVLSLFLLSCMPEKKPRYLFPLLIPAAYVMGYQLQRWIDVFGELGSKHRRERVLFRVNAWLITAVILILPVATWIFLYEKGYINIWEEVGVALFCLAVTAWLVRAIRGLRVRRVVYGVVILFLSVEAFGMPLVDKLFMNQERHSIATVNARPEVKALPCYHGASDPLRIELVYVMGRPIRPLEVTNADSLRAAAPCLLVLARPLSDYLSEEALQQFNVEDLGRFDDNPRPKENKRRYDEVFCSHLYVVKK